MKEKIVLICLLVMCSGELLYAQNWVRFNTKVAINYGNMNEDNLDKHTLISLTEQDFPITIYSGEIYKNKKVGRKDFIYVGNNILRCPIGFQPVSVDVNSKKYKDLVASKNKVIFQKYDDLETYKIDVSPIRKLGIADTIILVNKKRAIPFHSIDTIVQSNGLGKAVRLIVPNFPTFFVEIEKLSKYGEEPNSLEYNTDTLSTGKLIALVGEGENTEIFLLEVESISEKDLNKIKDKKPANVDELLLKGDSFFSFDRWVREENKWTEKQGTKRGNLAIGILILLGFLIGVYKLWRGKFGFPIYVEIPYERGSFKDYAEEQGTTVKKLVRCNMRSLGGYELGDVHTTENNNVLLNNIIAKHVIKGYSLIPTTRPANKVEVVANSRENKKSELKPTTSNLDIKEFIREQFKDQSNFITNQIANLKGSSGEQVQSLKRNIEAKETRLNEFQLKQEKIITEKNELFEELEKGESKITNLRTKYHELESNHRRYADLLLFTPYLERHGHDHLQLLEFVDESLNKVNTSILELSSSLTNKEISVLFSLNNWMLKSMEVEYWKSLFRNLSTGVITNSNLIEKLNGIPEEKDRIEFFQSYTYNRFWENYLNKTVLFLENIRIMDAYTSESTNFTLKIQEIATQCLAAIGSKSLELVQLEFNYVRLLTNYEEYNFTKLSSDNPKEINKKLEAQREDIIQIVSFGFKKNHGFENEDTWVIVK